MPDTFCRNNCWWWQRKWDKKRRRYFRSNLCHFWQVTQQDLYKKDHDVQLCCQTSLLEVEDACSSSLCLPSARPPARGACACQRLLHLQHQWQEEKRGCNWPAGLPVCCAARGGARLCSMWHGPGIFLEKQLPCVSSASKKSIASKHSCIYAFLKLARLRDSPGWRWRDVRRSTCFFWPRLALRLQPRLSSKQPTSTAMELSFSTSGRIGLLCRFEHACSGWTQQKRLISTEIKNDHFWKPAF